MRRILLLPIFVAATAIAFSLGKTVSTGDGIAADTASSSTSDMGGSVASPSIRSEAVRQAALDAIAGHDTYLSVALAESDSREPESVYALLGLGQRETPRKEQSDVEWKKHLA